MSENTQRIDYSKSLVFLNGTSYNFVNDKGERVSGMNMFVCDDNDEGIQYNSDRTVRSVGSEVIKLSFNNRPELINELLKAACFSPIKIHYQIKGQKLIPVAFEMED